MATFDINGKVALVTGGASGIGYAIAVALLAKGVKGVTLADVATEVGERAVKEIEAKFGEGKAIFVKTDVTNASEFEEAFQKTVEKFQNVDILINNAAIALEKHWERLIDVNLCGVFRGTLLGLETYLPKYKSGEEAVIINVSSIAGVAPFVACPAYTASKFGVHGLTLAWGHPAHFKDTKVKVIGVCPGITLTQLGAESTENLFTDRYKNIYLSTPELDPNHPKQTPEEMSPHVVRLIEKATSGTVWIVEEGQPPYQYEMIKREQIEDKNYID
ncbi:unnamed protein product [Ceutorhynchus assimilis]|uniref:15-hydroxyprostaglandin dehydrogenase [NAD(+)]-like n=1 Tax=Ceutorhynchus assimilis TaxID=467358 RepID=A0A9N9MXC6_9CUCU|nr:unnamed protein product [Ceutorhynchus assimilis]